MLRVSINAFPRIEPSGYIRIRTKYDPVLNHKYFFMYASGRAALFFAVKTASLPKGSRFLVPAFHCGVEVEAIKRAGYDVDFYNIKKDLGIDFEDLERNIGKQTRALVVIHYFGFPQNILKIKQFCDKFDLILFEDCAHALYSASKEGLLGSSGDFGIYSLRKTIGLPNGGGLSCNNLKYCAPCAGIKYFDYELLKSTVKSILEYQAQRSLVLSLILRELFSLYKAVRKNNDINNADLSCTASVNSHWHFDVPQCDYHHAISALSIPLLRKVSFDYIVRKRRINYFLLDGKLGDIKNVMKLSEKLEDGVCPLCYVVVVDNRDRIASELRRKGINPFIFGATLHPSFSIDNYPDIKYLSEKLLGLPVHQQLNEQDINILSDIFTEVIS